MTPETPSAPRGALLLLFVITFLNTLGMTLIMPIVPFLTQRYVSSPAAVAVLPDGFGHLVFE